MRRGSKHWKLPALAVAALLSLAACSKQMSEAERLTRGRELVRQMSDKLASASTLSFSTEEQRDIVDRRGQKRTVQRSRETVMRRPDRLHSKQTGDRPTDTWYDGKHVTIAVHPDKVYGQVRSPATLDETLDTLAKRFGITLPIGDLLHTKPESLLLSDDTKGGFVDTQNVDGVECNHLSFIMPGIEWELWLPTQGDPLPKRLKVIEKKRKGEPAMDVIFRNWNLAATASDETFKPNVPQDYEGIAVLQRAAVIRKDAPEQPASGPATKK